MKYKALLFSIFISLNALAMHVPSNFKQYGASINIGYSELNTNPIQTFIPKHLRTFNNKQLLIGGTGFVSSNKFLLGASGTLAIGDKIYTDSFTYAMSGAFGTLDFAYLLLNKRAQKVYPMIGIGSSAYGLGISRTKNLSKEQTTSNQAREIKINNGGLLIDLSLNLLALPLVKYNKLKNKNSGLTTGLKLGYIYGIKNTSWHYTGGIVTDGPAYGMRMLYVKLSLGGFSF
jgi:hypothetical protein